MPERSVLIVRTSGKGLGKLTLDVLSEGATDARARHRKGAGGRRDVEVKSDITELRYELRKSAEVRVLASDSELARWVFYVIPDKPPKIAHQQGSRAHAARRHEARPTRSRTTTASSRRKRR